MLRLVDARSVDEHILRVRRGQYAHDVVSGRIGLGRHDGDLLVKQGVEQRALAGVRPSDDRDKS